MSLRPTSSSPRLSATIWLARLAGIGADSTYKPASDRTRGTGLTFNLTPLAFATSHAPARALLRRYCELLLARPGRGAVHLVQASYESGYQPYVLPPQWCVCSPRDLDSKHLWLNAIALHVGHRDVLPRWKREIGLAKWRSRLAGLKGWR